MASEYGLNFGFRVSDEVRRISNGRVKTPAGSAGRLRLGTCVELDTPGNPGVLAAAGADPVPRPRLCGLLVQEEEWDRSFYEAEVRDSFDYGWSKPDTLSVITNGAGTKIWLKNTAEVVRGSRTIAAVTMFDTTGMAVGAQLGWDGTQWAAGATNKFMEVDYYDAANEFLEAVLLT